MCFSFIRFWFIAGVSVFLVRMTKHSSLLKKPPSHFLLFSTRLFSFPWFAGRDNACEKTSYMFLRKELPVRLANTMREVNILPDKLLSQPSVKLVQKWWVQMIWKRKIRKLPGSTYRLFCDLFPRRYLQSFLELLEFENRKPEDAHDLNEWVGHFSTL